MTDCYWQGVRYSEGSHTCQSGTLKECSSGEWRTIGICDGGDGTRSSLTSEVLKDVPEAAKDELPQFEPLEQAVDEATPLVLTRYADSQWIRRFEGWLYFSAGRTPGQVCVGQTLNYRVPIDDVISIDPRPTRCSVGIVQWKMITYRTGASP